MKKIASLLLTVLTVCTLMLSTTVTANAMLQYTAVENKTAYLKYNGIQYYHNTLMTYDARTVSHANYQAILTVRCDEEPDPEDEWDCYILDENGGYVKGLNYIYNNLKKGDVYPCKLQLSSFMQPCNYYIYYCCNGEVVATTKFKAEEYRTKTGSVISEGSLTVIVGVAAAVVFGLGGFFIGRKTKSVAAGGENNE